MPAVRAGSRSALSIIFTTVFVDLLGFGIVLPLLPYYARQFHASGFAAGGLIAVYSAMQFVCAPLWGRWSDRVGRRPVILISLAGSTASYAIFAFADGLGLLFVSRILAGIAGANIPVAQAFIADTTSAAERTRGMGLIGAAFGLGFVFGPAIGGALAQYGHAAPGFAAATICGLNLLAAWWRLPESHRPDASRPPTTLPAAIWRQPPVLGWLVIYAMAVFSFSTVETTLSLFCASKLQLQARQIYWLFGYMGILMATMQGGLIGRLSAGVRRERLVACGIILLVGGLVALPFAAPFATLLLALGAIAFGQGILSPVLSGLISTSVANHEQGSILGVSQSLASLARILGPLWGGLLFDHPGPSAPFLITAGVLAVAASVAPRLGGRVAQHGIEPMARRRTV